MTTSMKQRNLKGLPPTDKMRETIIDSMHCNIKQLFGYEPNDEGIKNLKPYQVHQLAELVKDNSMEFYCYQNANFAFRYILNVQNS